MSRKFSPAIALLLVGAMFLGACAPAPTPQAAPTKAAQPAAPTAVPPSAASPTAVPPTAAPKAKVAMILEGLINDGGWNATGYNSLMKAKDALGIDTSYAEGVSVANVEMTLRDYAGQGYDLIMAHSNTYTDVVNKVAKDYPNVHFAISEGGTESANVVSYGTNDQDTGYLAGVLAAYVSKSGKLGFIGGMQVPSMVAALNAYREGALSVNPNIQVLNAFPGVWNDTEKGRQAALAQIDAGADVILPRGDGLSLGAIKAAEERKVFAFGNAADQWEVAPTTILTSTVFDFSAFIKAMLEDIQAGEFGNRTYKFGLKEGGTALSDYHGMVPADVAEKVKAVQTKIENGELVVEEDTEMH